MKAKHYYIIASIISITIYFLLISKIDLSLTTPIKLISSGFVVPYWLVLILDIILFPLMSCAVVYNITKK